MAVRLLGSTMTVAGCAGAVLLLSVMLVLSISSANAEPIAVPDIFQQVQIDPAHLQIDDTQTDTQGTVQSDIMLGLMILVILVLVCILLIVLIFVFVLRSISMMNKTLKGLKESQARYPPKEFASPKPVALETQETKKEVSSDAPLPGRMRMG